MAEIGHNSGSRHKLGLGLDLATNTGFALGLPGAKWLPPKEREGKKFLLSGSVRLKDPKEDWSQAAYNLGPFLRNLIEANPGIDFIAVEAPLPAFVLNQSKSSFADKRSASFESIVMPPALVGAVFAVAGCYGIPAYIEQINSIRKSFCGRALSGKYEDVKAAVIHQAQMENLMPKNSQDDNRADAIACWYHAMRRRAFYVPDDLEMYHV